MIFSAISFTSFVRLLLHEVPELKPVYIQHIEDYDELLEHVFMGDVARFAEQLYITNPRSKCLTRLLDFLDKSYAVEDENLKELISVSFLENLSRDEKYCEGIRNLLGEKLSKELSKYN